jgi:hypothetical protein
MGTVLTIRGPARTSRLWALALGVALLTWLAPRPAYATSLIVSVPRPAGHLSTAVSALAARTASRSEQSPSVFSSSAVVVTVKLVA